MSERPVLILLADMRESIEKIQTYTSGMDRATFLQDDKSVDAVVRNLEIIGEAAARLPETYTTAHPNVLWHQIIGLRNRIVHEYFGVDLDIVWQIIRQDLPNLLAFLKDLAEGV